MLCSFSSGAMHLCIEKVTFLRLQRDLPAQSTFEICMGSLHYTFPNEVTSSMVNIFPIAEDGVVIEPVTIKREVETQPLGPSKTENIEHS